VQYTCKKIEFEESRKQMVTGEETKIVETTETTENLQNDYELVFIIGPDVPDDGLDPLINNITGFITGKAGVVSEVARWGRKKMAYPIKHVLEGNYVLIKFKLDPSANKELENNLKISEKILRYLLIKVD
jgi:small subunit ribosomal protein S6